MKHLSLSLVDAYLIVRSRRLSVLIQPNMRLLYNLCGWEIKLALERATILESEPESSAAADASNSTAAPMEGMESEGGIVEERRIEQSEGGKRSRPRIDEDKLRELLASAVSWPYLAKEVHRLNEKYLH
jgi:dual specificity MAP kinase phosphatase